MYDETIPGMIFDNVKAMQRLPALRYKKGGQWVDITWAELGEKVRDLAKGLMGLGIVTGDRVALLSENRPEWAMSDLAIMCCGAIDVPIYATNIPEQVLHILSDSEAKGIIVSHSWQLDKVLEIRDKVPNLEHIIIVDVPDGGAPPGVLTFEEVCRKGSSSGRDKELDELINKADPDDLVSFIYTSGTTGDPKGVMLSHRNFLSNVQGGLQIFPVGPGDIALSFLPLSHVFERTAGYYTMLKAGVVIAYAESIEKLIDNIGEVKPTVMCAVPRIYEKVHAGVMENAAAGSPLKKRIFDYSLSVGKEVSKKKLANQPIPIGLRAQYQVAYSLVFSKIHERMGGRMRFFVSGGAPLAKEIGEFFHSIGLLILEGYGMTETSPVITANRYDHYKFGTVGPAIPGVEVKIDEDGEILVKGPNVMHGYFKNEAATQETIVDGWLHTGDIGHLDEDGFLTITDRKKDIIVTAGGKNIAPQNIENMLKLNKYIEQVAIIGDKRRYLSALIVPEFEKLKQYAKDHGIEYKSNRDLIQNEEIVKVIQNAVSELNEKIPKYENIVKFSLIDREFTQESGELTPTLKLKRRVIENKYGHLIESMY